jgi:hypothetical protein
MRDITQVVKQLRMPAGTRFSGQSARWEKHRGHGGANQVDRVMDRARELGWRDPDPANRGSSSSPDGEVVNYFNTLTSPDNEWTLSYNKHYGVVAGENSFSLSISQIPKPGMGLEKALPIADSYVQLHNEAARLYKEEFKKVGARMWQGDRAHLLKKENRDFIAAEIARFPELPTFYNMDRPLTMLDSYPQVSAYKRRKLNAAVDEIWERYKRRWEEYKESLKKEANDVNKASA